jgi:carbamoyltransferase
MSVILGVSAYHGDASAALVVDGSLVAAVEEERFARIKHWAGFPRHSIRTCLAIAGVEPRDIDHFAIARDPRAHRWRKLRFILSRRPDWGLLRDRARNAARVGDLARAIGDALDLDPERVGRRLHAVEHHPSHLASSFFVSPFEEAAVSAIDGFGDFVSTSFAVGRDRKLDVLDRVFFPHSIGLLYLALTQFLGFPRYGDEFKVMGLAPYGEPDFVSELRSLVRLEPAGRFALDLSFFRHWSDGVSMTWDDGEPRLGPLFSPRLEELLGRSRRVDEPLEARHEALAASLQVVFEEALFHVLNALQEKTRLPRLCLAGGCAMNSVANGKIREKTRFQDVYIQPAAGDNGTALGAASYLAHHILEEPRRFVMEHSYWGPAFSDAQIEQVVKERTGDLERAGCASRRSPSEDELCSWTADAVARGQVVGWFQGRMEWGARALGNRSILADPRRADMRDIINTKIKFREKFRPFAPSIAEGALSEFFTGAVPDPFMIQVYPVRPEKRGVIPAVTHVDGTGRLQTVSESANPRYFRLIRAFSDLTGVPVLLNTSFNENEPIVHRPEEALDCFLRTRMDALVMGDWVLSKKPECFREESGIIPTLR